MIIGMAGEAGCGKDTAADYLVKYYNFKKVTYSYSLKKSLATLFCESIENYEDRDLKEQALPLFPHVTRRTIMQLFGTEFIRKILGDDAFIKLAEKYSDHPKIVNSSIRFENEATAIKNSEEGFMIHIMRPNNPHKIKSNHASEKPLEIGNKDFIIYNRGSIQELYQQLDNIIINITENHVGVEENES